MNESQKVQLIKLVVERKQLLYGKFDAGNTSTKKKQKAWAEIVSISKNTYGLNPIPDKKSIANLCNSILHNWKRATVVPLQIGPLYMGYLSIWDKGFRPEPRNHEIPSSAYGISVPSSLNGMFGRSRLVPYIEVRL